MIRGYYTAASGLVTQEKRLNTYANNISNANTVGFKRDNLILGTFGEHMTVRMNAYENRRGEEIGPSVYMQVVDEQYVDQDQGGFETTTRPLDMAIAGPGYFVIAGEDGEEYLTKDGQFSLDDEGYLVLPGFGRVQGEAGDLELTVSDIQVDRRGAIWVLEEDDDEVEAEQIGQLLIAVPVEPELMRKAENGLLISDDYDMMDEETTGISVRQFNLEKSNVNLADEMSRILESQRALQSCSQIVKMYDQIAETVSTQVSRV